MENTLFQRLFQTLGIAPLPGEEWLYPLLRQFEEDGRAALFAIMLEEEARHEIAQEKPTGKWEFRIRVGMMTNAERQEFSRILSLGFHGASETYGRTLFQL